MQIAIDDWKLFKFDDIFHIMKGFYNKKPEPNSKGNIPFLGATEYNNGVTEYYSLEDIEIASKTGNGNNAPLDQKIFPKNALCVTNNGSVGYAFFQPRDFTCSHDVNPLYLKNGEFTENTALFVATIIKADRYRWAYGRKWRPERMVKSQIKLPASKDGSPDWDYMDKYIDAIKSRENARDGSIKKALTTKNNVIQNLNLQGWREFRLGSIFDIRKGKRLRSEDRTEGNTVYIGAIDSNNGVSDYIGQEPIHKGNTISLSYNGSVGEAFYQPEDFWATDDVNVLYFKKSNAVFFNKYIALFICTILKQEKYRYSYGRKWVLSAMKETKIKLPVDKNDRPDWSYMEKFIKGNPFGDRI